MCVVIRLCKTTYIGMVFVALLSVFYSSNAQNITISGRIIDDHTDESLPFANVFLQGTTIGTASDIDGYFSLSASKVADSVGVSIIGYKTLFKPISNETLQTINFRLLRDDLMMEEVVILAGENPADVLLRKIIERKAEHDIDQLDNYQYEVYNKLEIDLLDVDEDFMDKKVLKPFSFILENVDSISEEKPFLPMFLTETLSDFYYQKEPTQKKEIIKASRVSGVENESVTQFLGNMYQQIDIYENWMPVMGKNFPSPIADNGFVHYRYFLIDSTVIDNRWSYKIRFKPKRKQDNVFVGDFWVADTIFAIQRVSMQLVAKDVNVNFVEKLSVYQEFMPVTGTIWAQKKDKLIIDFIKTKNSPGIIGRKSTHFKDFVFNDTKVLKALTTKEDLIVADDVFNKDESFWATARHDSLSENEKAIYAMIDTIANMPIARTYADIITIFVLGYKVWGPVEIGPYSSLVSSNSVEGWRVRLGGRTSNDFSTKVMAGLYGAYGFTDKRFKFGTDALWVFRRKPTWQTLYLAYKHDLDIEGDSDEEFGEDNLFAGLYRRNIPQKLMFVKSAEATFHHEWKLGFSNKISVFHKNMQPYFDYYYFGTNNELTEPINAVTTFEMKFNARFAWQEKFVSGQFLRTSLGSDYPILNLNYTLGLKGVLGSDYSYHKIELSAYDWFYVGSIGWSQYSLTAGKVFGTLPFLLLEIHPGNETFFFYTHAFNRMNDYEFISDAYTSLAYTHHFDGFFFNRVPLLRKLKLRSVVSGKMLVGSLSDNNLQANTDPNGVYQSFQNLHNEWGMPDWKLQTPSITEPYVEVAVGVENILKLFRVDAIWRLNYNDKPGQVGIRTGMELLF